MRRWIHNYKKEVTIFVCIVLGLLILSKETLPFQDFWSGVNNASLLIGIATFIISFITWSTTRQNNREIKQKRNQKLTDENIEQVALVIYVENIQIPTDVKKYLKGTELKPNKLNFLVDDELKNVDSYVWEKGGITVSAEKSIVSISLPRMPIPKDCTAITASEDREMEAYIRNYADALDFVLNHFKMSGIQLIHLFCGAPTAIATFTGSAFKNQLTVIGYQFAQDKTVPAEEKYYRTFDRSFASYLSEID